MPNISAFTEGWKCNEASGALLGENGYDWNKTGSGALGSKTGHVEDPATSILARGAIEPLGGASNNRYFVKAGAVGDIWDVRGSVSCTFAVWFKPYASNTLGTNVFNFYEVTDASVQAMAMPSNHPTAGANEAPLVTMFDGLTAFNGVSVQATDTVAIIKDTWNFQAGGYDAARNKLFHFWGRQAGQYFYDEVDSFAAGFGYSASFPVAAGRYISSAPFSPGSNQKVDIDQILWYNGRALTEDELVFLWNNHSGRAFDDLNTSPIPLVDSVDLSHGDYRNTDYTLSVMHRAEDSTAHPYSRPTLMPQDYTSDVFSKGNRDWSARYIRNYYTIPPQGFWQWYRVHAHGDAAGPYIKEDAIRLLFRLYKESQEHHIQGPTLTSSILGTANLIPMSYISKDIPKVADVVQWNDIVSMENFAVETKWVPPCPHTSWNVATNMFEIYGDANNYIRVSCLGATTPEREYNFEDAYAPHEPTWRLEKVRGGSSEFTRDFVLYHSYGGTGPSGEWMLEDTIKFQLIHFAGEICQLRIFKGEMEGYVSFPAPVAFGSNLTGDFVIQGPGLWSAPLVRNTLDFTREATSPGRVFPIGRSGFARRLQGPGRNPILSGERDPNAGQINPDKSNPYISPEDFVRIDSGNLGGRWFNDQSSGNGWSIVSNKAECEELGWERYDHSPKHRDYIIDARVELLNDNAYVGVFGRYERSRDSRTAYVARIHQTGTSAATLEIVRFWEGVAEVLSSDSFDSYAQGAQYDLKLTFTGTTISAKADTLGEDVYTGSTGVSSFTGSSITDAPLTAGRLVIRFTIGSVVYEETDDGAGGFNNVNNLLTSGSVDYTTGALTLGFDQEPDNGTNITAIQTEASTSTTDSFLPKPGRLGVYGATDAAGEKVRIDTYAVTRNHTVGIS